MSLNRKTTIQRHGDKQGRISASRGPKHDRKGAPNVDIIYHVITYQMQILLDKIKIELFVLNFQKVYSILFFAAFSLAY